MLEVQRKDAIKKLENAMVGVTPNAILEQSNTFVFKDGDLITFNGEIFTRQDSPFGTEIEGSIIANDFLKILQRLPDEVIKVEVANGEIRLRGKNKRAGLRMMSEILLPYGDIVAPEKWKKIPEGLWSALIQASHVCGKDETMPKTTHVHITPDAVEATDSFRVFRATLTTKIKKEMMVHANGLLNASQYKPTKMGATKDSWFHLKTEDGMCVALLCCASDYYDKEMLDELFDVVGETVSLPSNLGDILERASVMDSPTQSLGAWDSQISLTLTENLLKVKARKEEGWYSETKKVKYKGPDMTFSIHPTFLKELVARTRKVIISDRQIKVEVDNIIFTAALETSDKEE